MKFDDFGEELDADCGLRALGVFVADETGGDVGLAGAGVAYVAEVGTDNHDLEHLEVLVVHAWGIYITTSLYGRVLDLGGFFRGFNVRGNICGRKALSGSL